MSSAPAVVITHTRDAETRFAELPSCISIRIPANIYPNFWFSTNLNLGPFWQLQVRNLCQLLVLVYTSWPKVWRPAGKQQQPPPSSRTEMNRLANESEMKWMPLLYGVTAGLSSLVIVLMLVWIFHFRDGFAWQEYPAVQFNWHPILMVVSLIVLYGHGSSPLILFIRHRGHKKRKLLIYSKIFHDRFPELGRVPVSLINSGSAKTRGDRDFQLATF